MSDSTHPTTDSTVGDDNSFFDTNGPALTSETSQDAASDSSQELSAAQKLAQAHATAAEEIAAVENPDVGATLGDDAENAEAPIEEAQAQRKPKKENIDLASEELFPSLGSAPSAAKAPLWGAGAPKAAAPVVKSAPTASGITVERVTLEPNQLALRPNFGTFTQSKIPAVAAQVMTRTKARIEISTARKTGQTTFLIRGSPEVVSKAKRELMKEVAAKIKTIVKVPSRVRRFIIGAKGATLREIETKTGAHVQLPKREETDAQEHEDSEEEVMVDVTVEGDFDGVRLAKEEIEKIVDERTQNITARVAGIDAAFLPMIQAKISELEQGDLKIRTTVVDDKATVILSGDKKIVNPTKAQIEEIYAELQRNTTAVNLPVPARKHRFLTGKVQSILESTGCAVVLPQDGSDNVTVRGPSAQLGQGIEAMMNIVNEVVLDALDITGAHPNAERGAQRHASDVGKFLVKSGEMASIEKDFGVQVQVQEANGRVVFEIAGAQEGEVKRARRELVNAVNALQPYRFAYVEVDPLVRRHVQGTKNKNVQKAKQEQGIEVFFGEGEDALVALVHAGKEGDSEFLDREVVGQRLGAVKAEFEQAAGDAKDFVTKEIQAEVKFHKIIVGPKGTTLNAITGGPDAPIVVKIGNDETISIRGPSKEVDRVAKEILDLVEEAKTNEVLNSYTQSFDFPAKFSKNLIGKAGANITKLREELGVKIEVDEGKVEIQGMKKNVEEAKARVLSLAERLEDETIYRLAIPFKYHRALIGQAGKFVKRLEEKYTVRINFPRDNDEEGEQQFTDRPASKDEIVVKGGKKTAGQARDELMELYEYEKEHGFTETVNVPARAISRIVGREGAKINELKDETDTRIDIDHAAANANGGDENATVAIVIRGTKAGVTTAKKAIQEIAEEIEHQVEETIQIPSKYHRTLIGSGGNNLRDIVVKAGGPDDRVALARMVRFPRAGSTDDNINVKGDRALVDKVIAEFQKIVKDLEERVTIEVDIAAEKHRVVIGRAGAARRDLETRFNVSIDVPRQKKDGTPGSGGIKVTGKQEDVEKAQEEILNMTKGADSVVVVVPRALHRHVADGGNFIRQLRSQYNVSVDHGRVQLPKPASKPKAKETNGDAPRIDDEDAAAPSKGYAWEVVDEGADEEAGEDIPWNLRGEEANIEKAKEAIEKQIEAVKGQQFTGYLVVPAHKHRFIVGQGGSRIQQIRAETGSRVDVPRAKGDEVVVIKGGKDNIEKARQMILEATTAPGTPRERR
ncbi:hypothetical protein G7K_1723-t1 [Saitoella complicata NRRL Y-17804]|uniref:K Homology domain-containing protein n=2 Tax=Saitoella complicata (strain BCRC 22490 / CBS 7301 / JCM 7358 / NBRC 10748 / NRRL Y-17804) TaxID=698492 RepID=A0A0E9NCJ3_SAICN|nr:hypothetical protein G7K_1723-t1 [Saitoella complicata NRRL Y-17804]